ncbi:hypothetical protein N7462_010715 [Penicillium macrosclerotiorum]|uniref:uncharacterized protein n=1 Tax=Penicillium macrosclerotiorum TaxID=303699 RepID=UPI00254953CF|nr:uncharacterized protein N7462_010715 [Penicillium macrosclerotiorum]KAJ5669645.1 hypothetical protein N7462_010715 [Penicillium macrosclerotiorum]
MLSTTPARQRSRLSQSRPPASARSRTAPRTEAPELPPYETPHAPLSADAQRQLATLLQSSQLRNVKVHLQHATEKLTDSAGEINERLSDARVRYEKMKERRRQAQVDGEEEQDADNEEYQRLAETETLVDSVTGRMEEKMRRMIDAEQKLRTLTDSLTNIEKEEAPAESTTRASRVSGRLRPRRGADDDDEEESDDDEQDADYEDAEEREARERNALNPPSGKLDGSLVEGTDKWNQLTLTERYAGHNSYVGFYRIVHDSKFPGDEVPPLPHSSTWFSHLEDPNARTSDSTTDNLRRTRNQREPSPAESDDIAIERERISIRCPLTLRPFQDPVTSISCRHSFEREAILNMLSQAPATGRGAARRKTIKCPVCKAPLTAEDLPRDPVLLRRVRRIEAREAEEDHDEEGARLRDQRDRVTLASDAVEDDDAMDVDMSDSAHTQIKSEPVRIKAERQTTALETSSEDDSNSVETSDDDDDDEEEDED